MRREVLVLKSGQSAYGVVGVVWGSRQSEYTIGVHRSRWGQAGCSIAVHRSRGGKPGEALRTQIGGCTSPVWGYTPSVGVYRPVSGYTPYRSIPPIMWVFPHYAGIQPITGYTLHFWGTPPPTPVGSPRAEVYTPSPLGIPNWGVTLPIGECLWGVYTPQRGVRIGECTLPSKDSPIGSVPSRIWEGVPEYWCTSCMWECIH